MRPQRYSATKVPRPEGDLYIVLYATQAENAVNLALLKSFAGIDQGETVIRVDVIMSKPMPLDMVTVRSEEIGPKLTAEGKAIFYDIQFDFDKADIKPESEPQLAEMAKFLKADAATRVFIVGHTDNKGTLDYNLSLSGRRAEAVVKALAAKYGIDTKRLTPRGLGPLAPGR